MEHVIGKKWSDFSSEQKVLLLDQAEIFRVEETNQAVICTKCGANIFADYLPQSCDILIHDNSTFF